MSLIHEVLVQALTNVIALSTIAITASLTTSSRIWGNNHRMWMPGARMSGCQDVRMPGCQDASKVHRGNVAGVVMPG